MKKVILTTLFTALLSGSAMVSAKDTKQDGSEFVPKTLKEAQEHCELFYADARYIMQARQNDVPLVELRKEFTEKYHMEFARMAYQKDVQYFENLKEKRINELSNKSYLECLDYVDYAFPNLK